MLLVGLPPASPHNSFTPSLHFSEVHPSLFTTDSLTFPPDSVPPGLDFGSESFTALTVPFHSIGIFFLCQPFKCWWPQHSGLGPLSRLLILPQNLFMSTEPTPATAFPGSFCGSFTLTMTTLLPPVQISLLRYRPISSFCQTTQGCLDIMRGK